MADQAPVEAYGSARLETDGTMDMTGVFDDGGSSAMPLGYGPYSMPTRGYGYWVGPKGPHKGHAITFGRTRGGKGVSSLIPALLTYAGSMVVLDPKGENAWTTAERRRQLGNRVVILDPWGEVNRRYGSKAGVVETVTKFNPLSALDPADAEFHDDVMAIAEALIFQTGNDPHWSDSARELTGGLIAAEVQRAGTDASMRSVRRTLRAPITDLALVTQETCEDFPETVASAKLAAIVEVDDSGNVPNPGELASIRSTARTQTAFLDSARLIDSMETDETPFNLADLATEKVTLYLVLPVDRLVTHGRWLRMILTLAIRAIARLEQTPALPVVFLLDELGTISPGSGLRMIEQSFGLMAGLGIRIWAFLQDLPQLQRDYPHSWETFISNSSVIQLLNVNDNSTAEYFSRHLGQGTINAKTGSWSWKQMPWKPGEYEARWNKLANEIGKDYGGIDYAFESSQATQGRITERVDRILRENGATRDYVTRWEPDSQLMARSVLLPYEIIKAKADECVLIISGEPNRLLKRYVYYEDRWLSVLARKDPNRAHLG